MKNSMEYTSPQIRMIAEADRKRREAERQGVAGSEEDQARVLLDRIRCGELTRERVEAAAALEDPEAQQLSRIGLKKMELKDSDRPAERFLRTTWQRPGGNWDHILDDVLEHAKFKRSEAAKFAADCVEQILPVFEDWAYQPGNITHDSSSVTSAIAIARRLHTSTIVKDAKSISDNARHMANAIYRHSGGETNAAYHIAYAACNVAAVCYTNFYKSTAVLAVEYAVRAGLDESWATNRLTDYLMERV